MKLNAQTRAIEKKSDTKQIRREGNIPAVIYAPGVPARNITVDGIEFETVLRQIKQGMLPTTVFTLQINNQPTKAIVKDIQYALTTYKVIHLDFEELKDNMMIQVKVPVVCSGVAECAGIKLGGFLRQVIRFVKVKCLPKDLPKEFDVDIRHLNVGQSIRLANVTMPKGVTPIGGMNEVVVVIAKR